MITANLKVKVPTKKSSKALQLIHTIVGAIQPIKGLISCKAYQDVDDEDAFVMIQKWESGEAMEKYIKSSKYEPVMALMELSYEKPALSFDTVSATLGMKYLKAVRGTRNESDLIPRTNIP